MNSKGVLVAGLLALLAGCSNSSADDGNTTGQAQTTKTSSLALTGSIKYDLPVKLPLIGVKNVHLSNNLKGTFKVNPDGTLQGGTLNICDTTISIACFNFQVQEGKYDRVKNTVDFTGTRNAPNGVLVTASGHVDLAHGTAVIDSSDGNAQRDVAAVDSVDSNGNQIPASDRSNTVDDGNIARDGSGNPIYTHHIEATTQLTITPVN
jgi:hypothetical protein